MKQLLESVVVFIAIATVIVCLEYVLKHNLNFIPIPVYCGFVSILVPAFWYCVGSVIKEYNYYKTHKP